MVAPRKENARQAFAAWLATPKGYRVPATYTEMAAQLGVTERTLYNWAIDDDVQEAVSKAMVQQAADGLTAAMDALAKIAADPSNKNAVNAQRLLFEMTGHYTPGHRIEGNPQSPVVIEYVSPVKRKDTETPEG
ncbi:MAG: phBC6A51 family helix-turn-helix protein [Pseudomonadota bacterium]